MLMRRGWGLVEEVDRGEIDKNIEKLRLRSVLRTELSYHRSSAISVERLSWGTKPFPTAGSLGKSSLTACQDQARRSSQLASADRPRQANPIMPS